MAHVIDIGAAQARLAGLFKNVRIKQRAARPYDGIRVSEIYLKNSPVAKISVLPGYNPGGNITEWDQDDANDAAYTAAHAIASRLADYDYDCARVRACVDDKLSAIKRAEVAEQRLALVLGAKNQQPHMKDMILRSSTHSASVWLQSWADKGRGGEAFGYRFQDAKAFWVAHPEYRPIEWGTDNHGPWLRLQVVVAADR